MESVHPSPIYLKLPPVVSPSALSVELRPIPKVPRSESGNVARVAGARVVARFDVDAHDDLRRINSAIEQGYESLAEASPTTALAIEARIALLDKRAAEIIRRKADVTIRRLASKHDAAVRKARELLERR